MITKQINYEDFNGNQQTDTLYFNLTRAEMAEMELAVEGGFSNKLKEAVASQNMIELLSIFKTLLLRAYGVKSEDGKRFIKSETLREEFEQSAAFGELFFALISDQTSMDAFIKGLIPAGLNA